MSGEPAEYVCPVYGCRSVGARWITLHGIWPLAPCAEHADGIEAEPEQWYLVDGKGDRLRIARRGGEIPDTRTRH